MSSHDEGDGQPKGGSGGPGPSQQQKDLHGFVASLAPHEKTALKGILDNDSGSNSQAIAKGGASKEEQGKIAQASAKENAQNAAEENEDLESVGAPIHPGVPGQLSADEHDDIGKSMLDSAQLRGTAPNNKPRNLGERVKQSIASKLKAKGKI